MDASAFGAPKNTGAQAHTRPVNLNVVSGFLGAGKTTLINDLLKTAFAGPAAPQVVVLENEFGEVPVDAQLLAGSGAAVELLSSGCVCCTQRTQLLEALHQLVAAQTCENLVIEPTGLANLEDLLEALTAACAQLPLELNSVTTVVDATCALPMLEDFGEFYSSQLRAAGLLVLTRGNELSPADKRELLQALRTLSNAPIVWREEHDATEILLLAEAAWAARSEQGASELCSKEQCAHTHTHEHELAGIQTFVLELPDPLTKSQREALIGMLEQPDCGDMLRVKGFIGRVEGGLEHVELSVGGSQSQVCELGVCEGVPKLVCIGRDVRVRELQAKLEAVLGGLARVKGGEHNAKR